MCAAVVAGIFFLALNSHAREIGVSGRTEFEAPAVVEVRGRVNPSPPMSDSRGSDSGGGESWDERLDFLVDEWWKILIWVVVFLALFCLCCYFSRELLNCLDLQLVFRVFSKDCHRLCEKLGANHAT